MKRRALFQAALAAGVPGVACASVAEHLWTQEELDYVRRLNAEGSSAWERHNYPLWREKRDALRGAFNRIQDTK